MSKQKQHQEPRPRRAPKRTAHGFRITDGHMEKLDRISRETGIPKGTLIERLIDGLDEKHRRNPHSVGIVVPEVDIISSGGDGKRRAA
jgi:hypothetical protein